MHTNRAHFFKIRAVFCKIRVLFFIFKKSQGRPPPTLHPGSCTPDSLVNMLAKSLVNMLAEALVKMLAKSLLNLLVESLLNMLA